MGERRSKRKGGANGWILLAILFLVLLIALLVSGNWLLPKGGERFKESNPLPPIQKEAPALPRRLELPAMRGGQLVQRSGYSLSYDEGAEQPRWVAYLLTKAQIAAPNVPRTGRFFTDPAVREGSAGEKDYEASGYDRGHLAPAEDMSYSPSAMKESFYYSNISPQLPSFNRGVWKRLEELVRFWATAYDSIYVVTGPVLREGLPSIGPNRVAIPDSFYKVVLLYGKKGVQGIGFLLPHQPSSASLKNFAVSIDRVEKETGIDYFPALPDSAEIKIESNPDLRQWLWRRNRK